MNLIISKCLSVGLFLFSTPSLGFGNFILILVMLGYIVWNSGQCMKNFVFLYI